MVHQPYSVAVRAPSRAVFSFSPEERGLVRKVEPSLMVKKDGRILEQISFQEGGQGSRNPFYKFKFRLVLLNHIQVRIP